MHRPIAPVLDPDLGTTELERGMRAGRARDAALIGLIAVTLLLVVNSGGLARWTQTLPSSETNAWLAERAGDWHALMTRLGPAAWFEQARERLRPE